MFCCFIDILRVCILTQKQNVCILELLFAETSKNSADFLDLTEFGASSNQTEDTLTTCGKQSLCNVIILSDHGNIHLGTYDSFADAALRLYLHLYDIQSNKGSLGWCIKTLTYIPLQIIPDPHLSAHVLQMFPPFLDVKRLVSFKLECYILFKKNIMLH